MVKDELLSSVYSLALIGEARKINNLLEEFFSQNVVIPKRENRHPYADVWHEWLEDTSETLEYFNEAQECWIASPINYIDDTKWRIKPQEPGYEWQWLLNGEVIELSFYTEAEIQEDMCELDLWEKIEKTKRKRKQ